MDYCNLIKFVKIILLKDVKKIGKRYEVKNVADGFALNMLIPNKSAIPATEANLNLLETKRKAEALVQAKTEAELDQALQQIRGAEIILTGKVNDKGHLFAGLHKAEIISAIKKQKNLSLEDENIDLEKPLKEVGAHKVKVIVGPKSAEFTLLIKAEN